MNSFSSQSGLFTCAAFSCLLTASSAKAEEPIFELDEYVVSAGPVARPIEDFSAPFTSLTGAALERTDGSTLGAMLDGQLGVSATSFGAGASRPIIRGFDGPRVRILESGLEALDVSETSPDHAVAVEPMLVERIEVIRGPATLLYGSSAIGGVVNVIGREIPREKVAEKGSEGSIETRYETAAEGRSAIAYAAVGGAQWAVSITGLNRSGEDYSIPGHAELEPDEDEAAGGVLPNSFAETQAYSMGGTGFFGEGNYIGIGYGSLASLYGIPGHAHEEAHSEEDAHGHDEAHEEEEATAVSIDLERQRYDAELYLREPHEWIQAARLRLAYTDYEHTEWEGEETGTVFEKTGWELRGEISHRPFIVFDSGIIGIQMTDTDFSATGEEAFTPPASTRSQAVFMSEHIHGEHLHWDFGLRLERQSVAPEGTLGDYSDLATSLAAGFIWNPSDGHKVALSLQRSQRHPSSTELYADGPHLATAQYEIGEASLELETAHGLDLSYRYSASEWEATASLFYTAFEEFIFAEPTGAEREGLPVYEFTSVDARFQGVEAEIKYFAYRDEDSSLSYRLMGDYVSAVNEDSGDPLPRIPPLRLGAEIRFERGVWDVGALLRRSFDTTETAPDETTTDGYTEFKVDLAYRFALANGGELTVFARGDNLLDETIRHHTSFLKDVAPLPGRSLTAGLRLRF